MACVITYIYVVRTKKKPLPPDNFKNYQPVPGLCFISNLVERVVTPQLNDNVSSDRLENETELVSL